MPRRHTPPTLRPPDDEGATLIRDGGGHRTPRPNAALSLSEGAPNGIVVLRRCDLDVSRLSRHWRSCVTGNALQEPVIVEREPGAPADPPALRTKFVGGRVGDHLHVIRTQHTCGCRPRLDGLGSELRPRTMSRGPSPAAAEWWLGVHDVRRERRRSAGEVAVRDPR